MNKIACCLIKESCYETGHVFTGLIRSNRLFRSTQPFLLVSFFLLNRQIFISLFYFFVIWYCKNMLLEKYTIFLLFMSMHVSTIHDIQKKPKDLSREKATQGCKERWLCRGKRKSTTDTIGHGIPLRN